MAVYRGVSVTVLDKIIIQCIFLMSFYFKAGLNFAQNCSMKRLFSRCFLVLNALHIHF